MIRQQYPGFDDKRVMASYLHDRRTQCVSGEIQAEPGTPAVGYFSKEVTCTRSEVSSVLRHGAVLWKLLEGVCTYFTTVMAVGCVVLFDAPSPAPGNGDGAFKSGTHPTCARGVRRAS